MNSKDKMKKNLVSNLFFFSGILWIFSGIISEGKSTGLALGCAFITFGIVFRKKGTSENDNEEVSSKKMMKTITNPLWFAG